MYNQKEQIRTRNACTIYTMLDIMLYNFWIKVELNFILKVCVYLENLWVWSEKNWAVFKIIFNTAVKEINKKLWLNFLLIEKTITSLNETDKRTWAVWTPKLTKEWYVYIRDSILTFDEWKKLNESLSKAFWHSMTWDSWILLDHFWNKIDCHLSNMKELVKIWWLWDTIRTFQEWDELTKQVVYYTKKLSLSEANKRLKEYIFTNATYHKEYFKKAVELYSYGRDDKKQILDWYNEAIWQTE